MTGPGPEDKPLSNFTVRNVLETLREVSPTDFGAFLKEAGLERLQTAALSDEAPPTVLTSQLARLYAAVYRLMGETLTRVFLSNYGNKMAPMLLKHPEVLRLTSQAPSLPAPERVGWAVREMQKFLSSVWATVALREEGEAYLLEVESCPICAEIHHTRAPICASSEVIYTALLRHLSGQRLNFVEISCRSQGSKACSYRLRK